jgi:hypothetical protein
MGIGVGSSSIGSAIGATVLVGGIDVGGMVAVSFTAAGMALQAAIPRTITRLKMLLIFMTLSIFINDPFTMK